MEKKPGEEQREDTKRPYTKPVIESKKLATVVRGGSGTRKEQEGGYHNIE